MYDHYTLCGGAFFLGEQAHVGRFVHAINSLNHQCQVDSYRRLYREYEYVEAVGSIDIWTHKYWIISIK